MHYGFVFFAAVVLVCVVWLVWFCVLLGLVCLGLVDLVAHNLWFVVFFLCLLGCGLLLATLVICCFGWCDGNLV